MNWLSPTCYALGSVVSGLLLSSCLLMGAIDGLDNAVDCNLICNRYRACGGKHGDVVPCVESCQSRSGDSDDFMNHVDDCASCIDSSSCNIETKCQNACSGISPEMPAMPAMPEMGDAGATM